MISKRWITGILGASVVACALNALGQSALEKGFKEPPNIARPRVYWYWQNGNITATPTVVKNRLIYMKPDWKDAFHHSNFAMNRTADWA